MHPRPAGPSDVVRLPATRWWFFLGSSSASGSCAPGLRGCDHHCYGELALTRPSSPGVVVRLFVCLGGMWGVASPWCQGFLGVDFVWPALGLLVAVVWGGLVLALHLSGGEMWVGSRLCIFLPSLSSCWGPTVLVCCGWWTLAVSALVFVAPCFCPRRRWPCLSEGHLAAFILCGFLQAGVLHGSSFSYFW